VGALGGGGDALERRRCEQVLPVLGVALRQLPDGDPPLAHQPGEPTGAPQQHLGVGPGDLAGTRATRRAALAALSA